MTKLLFENIESLIVTLKLQVANLRDELIRFRRENETLKSERDRYEKRLQELTTLLELFQYDEDQETTTPSPEIA